MNLIVKNNVIDENSIELNNSMTNKLVIQMTHFELKNKTINVYEVWKNITYTFCLKININ